MKNSSFALRSSLAAGLIAISSVVLLYPCIFHGAPLGLNVPLLAIIFYLAIALCLRQNISLRRDGNFLLLLPIAGLSVCFALYNNAFLLWLCVLSLLLIGSAQITTMTGQNRRPYHTFASASDVCLAIFIRPFHKIKNGFSQLFSKRGDCEEEKGHKVWSGILIGLVIALPLATVLILLLSSADMVFSKLMGSFFRSTTLLDLLGWVITFVVFFVLSSSLLYSYENYRPAQPTVSERVPRYYNRAALYTILASMGVVLLVFSAVQILFLFGSGSLPEGVTYSEYARTGFFQLCVAAAIVFATTAICMRITKQFEHKAGFQVLYTLLLLSTLLLLVSSFMRMVLYEQAFQFTRLRLYVQAFDILLALITLFSIVKVWWQRFALSRMVYLATALGLLALCLFNVDGFIGTHNSKTMDKEISGEFMDGVSYRVESPSELDYLLSLSIDALPGYIDRLDASDFAYTQNSSDENEYQKNQVRVLRSERLLELYDQATSQGSILFYNFGRARAAKLLSEREDLLLTCRQTLEKQRIYTTTGSIEGTGQVQSDKIAQAWLVSFLDDVQRSPLSQGSEIADYSIDQIELLDTLPDASELSVSKRYDLRFTVYPKEGLDSFTPFTTLPCFPSEDGKGITIQCVATLRYYEDSQSVDAEAITTRGAYDLEKYHASGQAEQDEYDRLYTDEKPPIEGQYTYKISDGACFVSIDGGSAWREVPFSIDEMGYYNVHGRPTTNQLQPGSYVIGEQKIALLYGGGDNDLRCVYSDDGGTSWETSIVSDIYHNGYAGFVRARFCSFPTKADGYAVICSDKTMSQEMQMLYQTQDGGKTWHEVGRAPSTWLLQDASFPEKDVGFLVYPVIDGAESNIYRTQDGGKTWSPVVLDMDAALSDYLYTYHAPVWEDGKLAIYVGPDPESERNTHARYLSDDLGQSWQFDGLVERQSVSEG